MRNRTILSFYSLYLLIAFWAATLSRGAYSASYVDPQMEHWYAGEGASCGPACLYIIFKLYSIECDLESLMRISECGSNGTSMLGLKRAANEYGVNCVGKKLGGMDEISLLGAPSILHLDDNHFVVLLKVKENGEVVIIDPGKGLENLSLRELDRRWDGVFLELSIASKDERDAFIEGAMVEFGNRGIYITPSKWNIGKVPRDKKYAKEFYIVNNLARQVKLGKCSASCGCILSEWSQLDNRIIGPGEKVMFEVEVDGHGRIGEFRGLVSVALSDENLDPLYLKIETEFEVRNGRIKAFPEKLVFRNGDYGEESWKRLEIMREGGGDLKFKEIYSTLPNVDIKEVEDAQDMRLRNSPAAKVFDLNIVWGKLQEEQMGEIVVETYDETYPILSIPVFLQK